MAMVKLTKGLEWIHVSNLQFYAEHSTAELERIQVKRENFLTLPTVALLLDEGVTLVEDRSKIPACTVWVDSEDLEIPYIGHKLGIAAQSCKNLPRIDALFFYSGPQSVFARNTLDGRKLSADTNSQH